MRLKDLNCTRRRGGIFHLHVAGGHLGQRQQAASDAHQPRRHLGAAYQRQVGRDVVHLGLDELEHLRRGKGGREVWGWVINSPSKLPRSV